MKPNQTNELVKCKERLFISFLLSSTLMFLTNISQCNMSQCSLKKIEKMWIGWHPYPVHKFTNRMRSPTTHSVCNFFSLWQPNGMTSGSQLTNRMAPLIQSIRLTIYEPDIRLSGSQTSKNENKKWEPDGLIRVPYQKLQNCLIKEGYLNNFIQGSCGIKILYGGAGREYRGGGRICPPQKWTATWPTTIGLFFLQASFTLWPICQNKI